MDNALIDQPAAPSSKDSSDREVEAVRQSAARKFDVRGLLIIAALLGASGAYRYARDFQFANLEDQSRESPFPLKEIPAVLGGWRLVEGAETTLDPQIARLAGSTDHIVRTYQNESNGDKATVLMLYGPALLVWGHTPEICYPSTGYKPLEATRDVMVPDQGGGPGKLFRHGVYGRTDAGSVRISEVLHSFRNGGVWTPDMSSRWKQFRYNPGMFKIQVERQVQGSKGDGKECYDLLAAAAAEIERRLHPAAQDVVSK